MSALPPPEDKRRAVREMFDTIAPRYDLMNRILTLRLDVRWRRRAVRELGLAPGAVVADLACGTADLCRELIRNGCKPVGLDLSMGMLRAAREVPDGLMLVNADVLALPLADASLDGAVCGFALRNVTCARSLFLQMARSVRPGGRIALLEVDTPSNPLLRKCHGVYFGRVVPLIGAVLSDRDAYRYLPSSVAYLPEPAQLRADLVQAGFTMVNRQTLSVGIAQLITATRAG